MNRKQLVVCGALAALLALGGPAFAEICAIDDVPAATLLLPYFECDFNNPNGTNTLFTINNASAAPTIAHVTFWTDLTVPTLDFDIYLTGFDSETLNCRDIFNGILPVTADADSDPGDANSPQGLFSDDEPFNLNTSGPCGGPAYPAGLTSTFVNDHLQPCHTGGNSSQYDGGCCGTAYTDDPNTPVDESNIARGYITIDNTTQCSLEFPSQPTYWSNNTPSTVNQLWGDYYYTDTANAFASGETLVHLEACPPNPDVGTGANCPLDPLVDAGSFYARYHDSALLAREPLATTFATRYVTSATGFSGGTNLYVWRDPNTPNDSAGTTCTPFDSAFDDWLPMSQRQVVAFDNEENPVILCQQEADVSPPPEDQPTCFPLETGCYNLEDSQVPFSSTLFGASFPFDSGWLFLNLNTTSTDRNQAWVTTELSALGQFSVGLDAIQLDSACFAPFGGNIIN